jgi:Ala-tRNA(Pro) deacylase
MTITEPLTIHLDRVGIRYEVLPHPRTYRATDEADVLGISADEFAKTVVLDTGHGLVRAIVPASEHVDLEKVQRLLRLQREPRLALERELAAEYPEFELGAVPPVGGPHDRVVIDERLADRDVIVVESGSHSEAVRLRTRDLLVDAMAEVGDIADLPG